MLDSLRYGAGRWVILALLIAFLGVGGFFAYSKIIEASSSTTPATIESSKPSEAATEEKPENVDSSVDENIEPDKSLPYFAFPLPEGGVQSGTLRGDAKKDEAFIYVIVTDPSATIETLSEFFVDSLKKEKWEAAASTDSPDLLKVRRGKFSGVLSLRKVEGEEKYILSGILKPLF
jgi:hypothetical protein